jgi:hypothetical protein
MKDGRHSLTKASHISAPGGVRAVSPGKAEKSPRRISPVVSSLR